MSKMSEIASDLDQARVFTRPGMIREGELDSIRRMFDFHNRLRVMIGLDRHELVAANVLPANDHNAWGTFTRDPYRWFIRADDEAALKLWELIERRATKAQAA